MGRILSGRKGGGPKARRAIAIGGGSAVAVFGVVLATALGANSIGGNFEIDTAAGQPGGRTSSSTARPDIDWLERRRQRDAQPAWMVKTDTPSGGSDNSFGNGTKEDDAGSDRECRRDPAQQERSEELRRLQGAGVGPRAFLDLFWTRVQDPSGPRTWTSSSTSSPAIPRGRRTGLQLERDHAEAQRRRSPDRVPPRQRRRGGDPVTEGMDRHAWGPSSACGQVDRLDQLQRDRRRQQRRTRIARARAPSARRRSTSARSLGPTSASRSGRPT